MCGSGLVDCVAELVHSGLLDHSGPLHPRRGRGRAAPRPRRPADEDRRGARLRACTGAARTRRTRSSSPSATSASCSSPRRRSRPAGTSCCGELGVEPGDIPQVLLAGSASAPTCPPLSAIRIGLVPRLALPRIVSAGNVAGEGAKMAALSLRERAEARSILDEVEYVELSGPRRLQRRCSSTSSRSPDERTRSGSSPAARWPSHVRAIARRRGWRVDVHPLPRCCTTGPSGSPRRCARRSSALRDALRRRSRARTPTAAPTARSTRRSTAPASSAWRATTATTCFARDEVRAALEEEPGTYFLTDFLARTFEHTVVRELGLDRHPELRDDYFGSLHARAVARAAPTRPATGARRERAAARIGLPLEVRAGRRRRARARARAAGRRLLTFAASKPPAIGSPSMVAG